MAALLPDAGISVHKLGDDRQMLCWLRSLDIYREAGYTLLAVLEKVGGFIPDSEGNIGSAMFVFGQSYGKVQMALTACNIPYLEETPSNWQRALGIEPRRQGESKNAWKNRLKQIAAGLLPEAGRITLATADALLLACYCYNKYGIGGE